MKDDERAKINRRVAAAQREYRSRVRAGEVPVDVADQIVARYRSSISAPQNSYTLKSMEQLRSEIAKNEADYQAGRMTTAEYRRKKRDLVAWVNYFTITSPTEQAE